MNKLLNNILSNKNFKRWLGIILAIALVATMFPYMSAAYGNNDEPAPQDDPVLFDAGDSAVISEEGLTDLEMLDSSEDPQSDNDGIAVVADEQANESSDTSSNAIARAVSASIVWDSNKNATINAGDTVNLSSALTLPGTGNYTLTVNGTLNGVITVGANQTLNLKGTGTINGQGKGASVITVEGSKAKLVVGDANSGPTITGGTGGKLTINPTSGNDQIFFGQPTVGGGILVKQNSNKVGASLVFNNGIVSGNTAQAGGGIYIDRNCSFVMNNGTIQNNKTVRAANKVDLATSGDARTDKNAAHEGGGIYIGGTANIYKGKILNNKTATVNDWGGGGIFVESKGCLYFGDTTNPQASVLVTSNTANGLGGGISGCPHAKTGIGTVGGEGTAIAIYGNTAKREQWPDNKYLDKIGSRGDFIAKSDASGFTAEMAMDYYCTFASVVGAQYFKTDESYSWKGRLAYPNSSNTGVGNATNVTIDKGENSSFLAVDNASLGLTAAKPANPLNEKDFDVVIKDNESSTHGGGIGSNGVVSMGSMPAKDVVNNDWSLEVVKQFQKVNNTFANLQGGEFTFGVYKNEACTDPVQINGKPLQATNDANGKVVFNFTGDEYSGDANGKEYTFYVKEQPGSDPNIEYDSSIIKVVTNIKKITTTTSNGEVPWKLTTINSELASVKYFIKENGSWTERSTASTFTNKVVPDEDTEQLANTWDLEFTKRFVNNENKDLFGINAELLASKVSPKFTFNLYEPTSDDGITDGKLDEGKLQQIATAQNEVTGDNKGKVHFSFVDDKGVNEGINNRIDVTQYRNNSEGKTDYTFYVKEAVSSDDRNPLIEYDETWHKVLITINTTKNERVDNPDTLKPTHVTTYTSSLESVTYFTADENGNWVENAEGKTFVNVYHPEGFLSIQGSKSFYGSETEGFSFTLQRINAPENGKLDVNAAPLEKMNYQGTTQSFTNGSAPIKFDEITYTTAGDYWYMISEDVSEGVITDPRVYVVKVTVTMADDGMSLIPSVTELYYAEGIETDQDGQQTPVDLYALTVNPSDLVDGVITIPELEFSNFDEQLATMSAYGYAVNAASNEPIDQQCFVDPKIIKNLEGRSLVEGEFNFKLIELTPDENGVVDWKQNQGVVISETSNDRYGMVDFDKANNVSGDWENPSCLLYTAPGTYYYRVVEANELADLSVDYSQEIITFTTVIELTETGQLECTDMYYGHIENGENVRYAESENPQWHPTMTNYARGMDLQVRKTSALDRENGLEGATYGLYAVNNGDQADIFLGEGTSNEDGWITFKNVSLNEGTLYYFKERLAPAGHTVSEFRSSYFYLVKDLSAPNGYTMMYTDSKAELGSKANESDIVALAETRDAQDGTQGGTPQGAQSEDGNMLFTFEQDGGVFDEATYTEVAKVDTRTHEWVEGAELSIIEKDTGTVINSWTSGTTVEVLQGKLNVDTTYILREDKAPEGYAKADDVEFKIDQYGAVEILSGTSNGNAELQDATIRLYDTMLDAEVVETVERENVVETPDNTAGGLSKTGDYLPIAGVALLALGSLIVLLVVARRNKKNSSKQ